jgi:hypothetical protein
LINIEEIEAAEEEESFKVNKVKITVDIIVKSGHEEELKDKIADLAYKEDSVYECFIDYCRVEHSQSWTKSKAMNRFLKETGGKLPRV